MNDLHNVIFPSLIRVVRCENGLEYWWFEADKEHRCRSSPVKPNAQSSGSGNWEPKCSQAGDVRTTWLTVVHRASPTTKGPVDHWGPGPIRAPE